jgi:hypothetical protein
VRKFIYGMPVPRNLEELIAAEVRTFFDGVGRTLEDLVAPGRGMRQAPRRPAQERSR